MLVHNKIVHKLNRQKSDSPNQRPLKKIKLEYVF